MRRFWFTTERMTVSVDVDAKGIVVEAAPVVQKFVGQPVKNLADWLRKQPGFDWKELYGPDVVRTIVAGSRSIDDFAMINDVMSRAPWTPTLVISGAAKGPDQLGERWARANGIPVKVMPADWKTHGKKAGYLRNEEMARVATHLVAFWDGHSNGTKHMIDIAKRYGLATMVVRAIRSPETGHWQSEPVPVSEAQEA